MIIAETNAANKTSIVPPSRDNESKSRTVSNNISILMTNVNNPSVRRVNGSDIIFATGRITAFTKPKTIPTINRFNILPLKVNPGINSDAIQIDRAFIKIRKMSFTV